jgi:virulence-associated protein VagC
LGNPVGPGVCHWQTIGAQSHSQAVRLPAESRLPNDEVRASRQGRHLILEPAARDPADVRSVFAEIGRLFEGVGFFP